MKKVYLPIVLIIALAMILSACQQTPATPEAPAVEEPAQPAATEAPAAAAPTEAPAAEEPAAACTVKLGVPSILTGTGAPMGQEIKAGADLAVEKINADGGILDCQIELVYTDVKNETAEDCSLAAQVMDQAGVAAYFPGAWYGTACIEEFGKRDAVLMHGSASKDMMGVVFNNLPEYNNIFMLSEDELAYGPNNFDVINNVIGKSYTFPNKKVALLGGNITYDMYIQKSTREAFEAAGWEVVLDDVYEYGTTEFGSQLAKIRAENPAVIMGQITSTDSSVAFMNQFLNNPTNSLIYIQWSPASSEFIGLLGEKANGILWSSLYDILPENQDAYYSMFETKYDRLPGTWPPVMWDHFQVYKAAVESCGSFTDNECIVKYFDELDAHPVKGLCGTYGMNPDTNIARAGDEWVPIQFIQIQDQKNVKLFLGTKSTGAEFQVPPWIEQ